MCGGGVFDSILYFLNVHVAVIASEYTPLSVLTVWYQLYVLNGYILVYLSSPHSAFIIEITRLQDCYFRTVVYEAKFLASVRIKIPG